MQMNRLRTLGRAMMAGCMLMCSVVIGVPAHADVDDDFNTLANGAGFPATGSAWNVVGGNNTHVTRTSLASDESPFTGAAPGRGVRWVSPDGQGGASAGFSRPFASMSDRLRISMDFRINDSGSNNLVPTLQIGSGGTAGLFLNLSRNVNGALKLTYQTDQGVVELQSIAPGTWYHLVIETSPMTDASKTFMVALTPFGSETSVYSNLSFRNSNFTSVAWVRFINNTTNAGTGSYSIDNVEIVAIPGPYPADIAAWDEATKQQQRDAGQSVLSQVAQAAAGGASEVRIAPGHYRFNELIETSSPTHIRWANLHDITLDFQGSTLWFETPQSGIVLSGCRNVTLKNVKLDWDPLPFIQGRIVGRDAASSVVEVMFDPGYERVSPGMAQGGDNWRGAIFDPETYQLKAGQQGFQVVFDWNNRTPEGAYRVWLRVFYNGTLDEANIAVGDLIAMFPRAGRAVRLEGSDDMTLEEVTLYASPFVGFSQNTGEGQMVYRNCRIIRRPETNRLMAGNADGFNVTALERGPVIRGCEINALGDDFVNVHSHYARLLWQSSPTGVIISVIPGRPASRAAAGNPVTLTFYDRVTMTRIGSAKAVSVQRGTWTPTREQCLADLAHKFASGEAAKLAYDKSASVDFVELDQPASGGSFSGDIVVVCEEFSSAGAVIRDCYFSNSTARGIRLQSPEALIKNNLITNTIGHGITMFGQPSYWGEGPFVHSTLVIGNTLVNTMSGSHPGVEHAAILARQPGDYQANHLQYDIRIESNTIAGTGGPGIVARGVNGLTVKNNLIRGYALNEPGEQDNPLPPEIAGTGYAIVVESCDGVQVSGNTITEPGPFAEGQTLLVNNTSTAESN